jgi:hypothetical protein
MADRREGRGQLSSIDLLPEEAQDDITWALGELNARQRTQADILLELNDRLAVKGIDPISKSAFSRYSVRLFTRVRRTAERQRIYEAIAPQLSPDKISQTDLILGEFLKTLIDSILDMDGALGPRDAHDLAKAFHHTVQAEKVSAERRSKLVADFRARTEAAVDGAVAAATAAGAPIDGAALLKRIREDVYGIFDGSAA